MKPTPGRALWRIPLQRRDLPLITCMLLVLGLQVAAPAALNALRYDRVLILAGQYWRLVSGHFVHLNWTHALMDLAGLAALRLIFPEAWIWEGRLFVSAMIGFALGISLMFLYFDPGLAWYAGLSGVLHAVAAVIACTYWRFSRVQAALLLAGLVVKLYLEQAYGPSPLSASMIGAPVVTDAHLYGAVLGGTVGLAWRLAGRMREARKAP